MQVGASFTCHGERASKHKQAADRVLKLDLDGIHPGTQLARLTGSLRDIVSYKPAS